MTTWDAETDVKLNIIIIILLLIFLYIQKEEDQVYVEYRIFSIGLTSSVVQVKQL